MSETSPFPILPDPLGPEDKKKRAAPWGEGRFVRVLFPIQVRRNADLTYTARCRELGITTGDVASDDAAVEALRKAIRDTAVAWAKQRVGS